MRVSSWWEMQVAAPVTGILCAISFYFGFQ